MKGGRRHIINSFKYYPMFRMINENMLLFIDG